MSRLLPDSPPQWQRMCCKHCSSEQRAGMWGSGCLGHTAPIAHMPVMLPVSGLNAVTQLGMLMCALCHDPKQSISQNASPSFLSSSGKSFPVKPKPFRRQTNTLLHLKSPGSQSPPGQWDPAHNLQSELSSSTAAI